MSALFRGITSNNNGGVYYINCFDSSRTENKLKKHKSVWENHDYCYIKMPKEDNKILKDNHGEKSMKVPFIIYADLESLLQKVNTWYNNPKKSSTTKINKRTPSGYLLFTDCLFATTRKKLDYYRGKNCMKNCYLGLRERATEIINYKKKKWCY